MPLQKLQFRPGLNREGTDYSNEGGWYDGDKIRFRSGFPEKIGGWTQVSNNQFSGVCRSLWIWLDGDAGIGNTYIGVGTNTKYYIYYGGVYNDITPIIQTDTLTNPFATTLNSTSVTVTDGTYSPSIGDYVYFSGATSVGGVLVSGDYVVTSITSSSSYTITVPLAATSTASGGGTVTAQYEYPTGNTVYSIGTGWGAGPWGGINTIINTLLPNNPFSISAGSNVVTVNQPNHGYLTNAGSFVIGEQYKIVAVGSTDFTLIGAASNAVGTIFTATGAGTGSGTASIVWVAFTGVTGLASTPTIYSYTTGAYNYTTGTYSLSGVTYDTLGANYLDGTFQLTYVNANTYTITVQKTVASNMVGGGANVIVYPETGTRGWGSAYSSGLGSQLRLWSNDNYGADLVIAPRGGAVFYWQDSGGVGTRAQYLSSIANSTVAFTDSGTSFGSSATSITVSSAVAPSVYPYMVITGTNLPANTKVASNYITGATTVPITTTTTGSSSGIYNFSYAGAFVPTQTFQVITSAIQEFVICFGANSYVPNNANTTFNPLLVRWSDQANAYQWVPQLTNQSGEYLLTNGSYIMGARATRQEILVWTDSCLYSMQYLGAPYVWGFQILMDNISVMSPNSMITINNVTYWMGRDRFYMYSGRVEVLPCALRQYIFDDINENQAYQVFAGANEAFNEVWWYYVSQSSSNTVVDKYVIYNYLDRVWYYGTMGRTAWMQTGTQPYPVAADYNGRLLYHENGTDDNSTTATLPIDAYVQSSDFDIGDGHNFGFVWRILPDVNFNGSTTNQPSVTMTVKPRENSGTAYGQADNPQVQSAQNYTVAPQYTVQQFTGQVYTRLRGRQMAFRIESTGVGVAWQLGSPRIDIRPDGRR